MHRTVVHVNRECPIPRKYPINSYGIPKKYSLEAPHALKHILLWGAYIVYRSSDYGMYVCLFNPCLFAGRYIYDKYCIQSIAT